MKKIESLSVPFYEFQCDLGIINRILPKVHNLQWRKNEAAGEQTASTSIDFFYDEQLIKWFDECVEQVRQIYFDDSIKLEITNCWATKTNGLAKQHKHTHQQALVSGILYLDTCNTGETIFYMKNPWQLYQNEKIMHCSIQKWQPDLSCTVKQETGKLVLFPSSLEHGTKPNKEKKLRYSIAFDAFFSGKLHINSHWPYFEIKTTNIHEVYQKSVKNDN